MSARYVGVKRQMSAALHDPRMGSDVRVARAGVQIGQAARAHVADELRSARIDRHLTQDRVGAAVGMSRTQVSLAERGKLPSLRVEQAARLLAAVGLRLSVRAYPTIAPVRDAGQRAVLDAFRGEVSPILRWGYEVPIPIQGDLRAWDAVISGAGWRVAVEAETGPRDVQALQRRLQLKLRDSGIESVVLVLLDSRVNRELLRVHGPALEADFPVSSREAIALLADGRRPPGNAIALVRVSRNR
jgi:transcriptional regulator with XRE-family HTH domain